MQSLCDQRLLAFGLKCHVGRSEDRKNLFQVVQDKFGGLDILVSNVGINIHVGKLIDCTESAWIKMFDTNVKASFLLTKEAVPLMKNRKDSSIIIVSGIEGFRPVSVGKWIFLFGLKY